MCRLSPNSPAKCQRGFSRIVDGRRDHQLGNVGARVKLDQESDRGGDVVGLEDDRAAFGRDGDRTGVEDRRFDLARIDHRRADAARPSSRPRQIPSAAWPNFEAE